VADPRAEPAIGTGQHVLPAAVADDVRNQCGAYWKLHLLEDPPLVLVARARRFDRIASGAHPEDQIDDVLEGSVVVVGKTHATDKRGGLRNIRGRCKTAIPIDR
jgi:hypothetical protein